MRGRAIFTRLNGRIVRGCRNPRQRDRGAELITSRNYQLGQKMYYKANILSLSKDLYIPVPIEQGP